jgi:hypothetical protein
MSALANCRACGSAARMGAGHVECTSIRCLLVGPINDPTGAKWNALMAPGEKVWRFRNANHPWLYTRPEPNLHWDFVEVGYWTPAPEDAP